MTIPSIAYRKDVALRGRAFGERDGAWLIVATALEHAAGASPTVQKKFITGAAKEARRVLGPARVRRMAAFHWNGTAESPFDVILLLAYTIEDADALWLADSIAANALAAESHMTGLQQGRFLSLRGRLLQKLGQLDAAYDLHQHVARLGRALKNFELQARAANSFAGLAFSRGNNPLASRYRRQTLRLAEKAGIRWLRQRAHLGLVTDAARRKDFSSAVKEAWTMMQLSEDDPIMHAADLQTFGEVLLHMGEASAARSILTQVVRQALPGRILLPALGGLALACARSGDVDGVEWVLGQVRRLRAAVASRYLYVQLVLECAEAAAIIGHSEAALWRDRALRLARLHGFHEFVFRAEAIEMGPRPSRVPTRTYAPRATRILHSVRTMEPPTLPARIALAPASEEG